MKRRQVKKTQVEKTAEVAVKTVKDDEVSEDQPLEPEVVAVKDVVEAEKEQNEKIAVEGDAAGSDDDAAVETPIGKEEPTIPSKVKSGQIPADFPHDQIVHVNKLPKTSKLIDVVEIFAKYGPIEMIHFHQGPVDSIANVAFKTATAATAALAAHKHTIGGSTILVTLKRSSLKKQKGSPVTTDTRERCVYVKYLKRGTKSEQLSEHFADCGEIDNIRVVLKNSISFGFVTFVDKAAVEKALELHNTLLNGTNIGVFRNKTDASDNLESRNPNLTIIVKNKQSLESIEGPKLETIFAKCGEITNMDVVCKKKILAFITFATEEGKQKALELNGQTLDEIEIEVEVYNPDKLKTSIFIINIAKDATEEDISAHFSKAGEISAVILRKGFAIVHFKDSDGYCKSFLLNETILKGQMIFLEPYSVKKQNVMKNKQQHHTFTKKRPASNGKGVFTPKRLKVI